MLPEEAEELARKTQDVMGWSMPNQAVQDSATEKLGEVLGCARKHLRNEIDQNVAERHGWKTAMTSFMNEN